MFNIGGSELIVILFVALIFLGPERLPTAAKQVGKTIATLRGMAQGFQREFEDAVSVAEDSARELEARAKGAELVAASKVDDRTTANGAAVVDEPAGSGESDETVSNGSVDPAAEDESDALVTSPGFDPTAEPDRTEKPVSADGPMFHSAGPGVGPKIARREPVAEADDIAAPDAVATVADTSTATQLDVDLDVENPAD